MLKIFNFLYCHCIVTESVVWKMITESQNGLGRDLRDHLVPNHCLGQGCLVGSHPIQPNLIRQSAHSGEKGIVSLLSTQPVGILGLGVGKQCKLCFLLDRKPLRYYSKKPLFLMMSIDFRICDRSAKIKVSVVPLKEISCHTALRRCL